MLKHKEIIKQMLNDALNSSFSPAGQKSFNKRLKDLEQKIDGYDESIKTGTIEANNGEIKNLKSENIETDNLKVNVEADIENLKFRKAEGTEATIGKIAAQEVETVDLKATNAETTNLKATNVESENVTVSDTVDAETVNAKNLSVENIIEELNLKKLNIRSKEALGALAEAVLDIGKGYADVTINSTNRPKWMESKIVTEEQLTTPFTLRGVVDNESDLPSAGGSANTGTLSFQNNSGQFFSNGSTIDSLDFSILGNETEQWLAEWAQSDSTLTFEDYLKAKVDNLDIFADPSDVGQLLDGTAYSFTSIADVSLEHQYVAEDNMSQRSFNFNEVEIPLPGGTGSGEGTAAIGDVYMIKNSGNPEVAICVPGNSGGAPIIVPVSVPAQWTHSLAYKDSVVKGITKDLVNDGEFITPDLSESMRTEAYFDNGEIVKFTAWQNLADYVAANTDIGPVYAATKYIATHTSEFNANIVSPGQSTYATRNVSIEKYFYNTWGASAGDTVTVSVGSYVPVTVIDYDTSTNEFTFAFTHRSAQSEGWQEVLSWSFDVKAFRLERLNLANFIVAPGAPDLSNNNYQTVINSMNGQTYTINVVVNANAVWYIIPFPVLQMYRTAADQNVIDANLQSQIDNINIVQDTQNQNIEKNAQDIADNKAAQDIVNENVGEAFDAVERDINDLSEQVEGKISDAPANGKVYGRKDHAWVNVATDGMYVPKVYNKVEKYFTNITLKKDPSYVNTSQLVEILIEGSPVNHYVGLWHLQPAESGDLPYTTKNMYDFVKDHQDIINETVYQGVVETFEAGRVLGTLDNVTYQDLGWYDTLTEFDSTKPGDDIYRPDGATLGTNTITSNDNGVDINSDLGFTANTPSPAADSRSVINRQYINDNMSLSTSSSSSGASGAILEFKKKEIDLVTGRAWSYQPRCQMNLEALQNLDPEWYHRCKDYVYYKLDNVANQSASSFSFWMSVDRNGNVINMTNPREDKGNATANQSEFERWMTYSPELWESYPETANVAYWPHTEPTYAGYITMFDNGRFNKYVEDATGVSNSIYRCPVSYYDYRCVGGKSLRGSPRMLMVNNSAVAEYNIAAGIIGIDSNNVEGLDKFKFVTLPSVIKHGFKGVAAGKKHWFAQQNTSNTFMVISGNGTVASYVLSDPVTQIALGTTVQNAQENYIELANGDAIFCVKDYSTDIMYHIYCHDNFEEEGVDPFTVYRSAIDFSSAANDGWPCCKGFPYVEFGDYVYFFPTLGSDVGGTNAWLANNTMASQYSRFNKSTKTWSDATLPWNNSGYGGVVPVKTYDPIEDKDYLWIFQSQTTSTEASPCQAQVVVISENGALQYVDLGTGTTIHWFDNTARTGETLIGGYSRPLNISGDIEWRWAQTVRGNVPYVAVTQQGIGIMLSNAARDVCVFYGNCHFAIYSYDNATDGGPWSYFSGDSRRGPSFIGGKYGAMLYVTFNNAIDLAEQDSSYGCIYIKPTGDDYLGEPVYFWKPTSMDYIRMWREKYDGADWAKTDFSDYRKAGLVEVTPAAGGWEATIGMSNIRIEDIPASSTLYLKDGDNIISSVNIGGSN